MKPFSLEPIVDNNYYDFCYIIDHSGLSRTTLQRDRASGKLVVQTNNPTLVAGTDYKRYLARRRSRNYQPITQS